MPPAVPTQEVAEEPPRTPLGLDVLNWRFEQLERAGFPVGAAIVLAERGDIDLHVAVGLLARGCPAELAVAILT